MSRTFRYTRTAWGFFEHEGRVIGDAQVSLHLTSAQLNDVLQSLTAIDLGGGHFTGANYNSTTPLAQQLRSLAVESGSAAVARRTL